MKKLFCYTLALLVLCACDRDKIGPQSLSPAPEINLEGKQVLILNEGNFQRGNASLSAYNAQNGEVQHNIFSRFNKGVPLGDVAQDLLHHQGRYYLSLNGSGSVRVIDSLSWQSVAEIPINGTPTYMAVAEEKLYLSDLFKKRIWQINLNQLNVTGSISTPAPASHLRTWKGKIVAVAGKKLLVIDAQTGTLESTKKLPGSGGRMVIDHHDKLWLITSGNRSERTVSSLSAPSDSIISFPLGQVFHSESPKYLSIDGKGKKLFMIYENHVYQKDLNSNNPNLQKLFSYSLQTLYGFNIAPLTGDFYISDALDFDQASDIYRFDSTGTLIRNFKAGRITNGFYFQ